MFDTGKICRYLGGVKKKAKRDARLTCRTAIRCTQAEKDLWEAAARSKGVSLSSLVSDIVNRALKPS